MAADVTKQIVCRQVAATTSSGQTPIFLGGVKKVILQNITNDCYVDFDQPVAPTTSFRLLTSAVNPLVVELEMGLISNLYIQSVTGSATVYLIVIAG